MEMNTTTSFYVRGSILSDGHRCVKKESRNVDFSAEIEAQALTDIYAKAPELSRFYPALYGSGDGWVVEREIVGVRFNRMAERLIAVGRSAVIRTLTALTILVSEAVRERAGIVHNELIPFNVIIVEAPEESIVELDVGGKSFRVETFGYRPIIVNMGLAYNPNSPVLASCRYVEWGMSVDVPDPICDARTLLAGLAGKFGNACGDWTVDLYRELFVRPAVHVGQLFSYDAVVYRTVDDLVAAGYDGPNDLYGVGSIFSIRPDSHDPNTQHTRFLDLLISGVKMAMTDDPAGMALAIASARIHRRSSPVYSPYGRVRETIVAHTRIFEGDEMEELRFIKRALTDGGAEMEEARRELVSLVVFIAPTVLDTLRSIAERKYEFYAQHYSVWNGAECAERLLGHS